MAFLATKVRKSVERAVLAALAAPRPTTRDCDACQAASQGWEAERARIEREKSETWTAYREAMDCLGGRPYVPFGLFDERTRAYREALEEAREWGARHACILDPLYAAHDRACEVVEPPRPRRCRHQVPLPEGLTLEALLDCARRSRWRGRHLDSRTQAKLTPAVVRGILNRLVGDGVLQLEEIGGEARYTRSPSQYADDTFDELLGKVVFAGLDDD